MEIHTNTSGCSVCVRLLRARFPLRSSKNGFLSPHLNEGENNFLQFSPNYEPKNA